MAYAASCKCDKANLSYKIADCHILLIEAIYVHAISNNYSKTVITVKQVIANTLLMN